jgi:hypothetical protein
MKRIQLFEAFGSTPLLPSNVMEWLKRAATSEQEAAAKKVGGWAKKAGTHITGGTTIGKSPQTLILDIKHQGSEIYIDADGTTKFNDVEVTTPKQFADAFEKYKRSSEENRKYFKVQDAAPANQQLEENEDGLKLKAKMVIMSHLSDAQEELAGTGKVGGAAAIRANDHINFAKFLLLKHTNTDTEIDAEEEYAEYEKKHKK